MEDSIQSSKNFSPIERYKLYNIITALFPVLKNTAPEHIKDIAEQEVIKRRTKEKKVIDLFPNREISTRSDDGFYINFHKSSAWINPHKGDIEIINRTDWRYSNVHIEKITPNDLLKINQPTGSKIWNNKLEIIPLEILGKQVWQIGILSGNSEQHNKEYFYVCLSADKIIEVISNESGYLSGDYSHMIDNYKPGTNFQVQLTPFTGITSSIKGNVDVFTPNEIKTVDFNEFLLSA